LVRLSLFGTRIYIIGSIEMMPLIQRQPRAISSRCWFAKFVCSLIGCSSRSMGNFQAHLGASSTGDSMLLEGVRATKRILNSKAGTDMNHNAAHMVSERFKSMPTLEQTASVDLFDWIKHEMLHLVSDGIPSGKLKLRTRSGMWQRRNIHGRRLQVAIGSLKKARLHCAPPISFRVLFGPH
jgi:hypothetical protein